MSGLVFGSGKFTCHSIILPSLQYTLVSIKLHFPLSLSLSFVDFWFALMNIELCEFFPRVLAWMNEEKVSGPLPEKFSFFTWNDANHNRNNVWTHFRKSVNNQNSIHNFFLNLDSRKMKYLWIQFSSVSTSKVSQRRCYCRLFRLRFIHKRPKKFVAFFKMLNRTDKNMMLISFESHCKIILTVFQTVPF